MRRAALVLVVAAGCASGPPARSDDPIVRLAPTLHDIMPTRPSAALRETQAHAPIQTSARFNVERIVLEEPTFHEHHALQWQREVRAYTAEVLNRASDLPDGAPLQSRARFSWSFDRRYLSGGSSVTVELATMLPDGRVVTSQDVRGEVVLWNDGNAPNFLSVLALTGLGTGLGVDVAMLALGATLSPIGWGLMGGALAVTAVVAAADVLADVGRIRAAEQRWSDLYLIALTRHAADVRSVVVDGTVPTLTPPPAAATSTLGRSVDLPREHATVAPAALPAAPGG